MREDEINKYEKRRNYREPNAVIYDAKQKKKPLREILALCVLKRDE